MDLSIIVPVYNVEQYVRTCIESIYKQGLDEDRFEVLIVNDGTKDKSMEVIQDIIAQHKNIVVINQENQGLSMARNNGMAKAKGQYILMIDSDDLLIENSLSRLLDLALEEEVDLLVADFLEMDNEIITSSSSYVNQNRFEFKRKTGIQLFLEDLNPNQCYVWRTLYKRSFILENNLKFVPGIRYQDVPFTHEAYIKANNCIKTSWLLNIYRKNRPGASTHSFSFKKAKDFCVVIRETWKLRKTKGLPPMVVQKIKDDVYATFSTLFYHTLHTINNPLDQYEILKILNQEVPDLFFTNGRKQKIETLLFKHMPSLYLKIRRLHWDLTHFHQRID